MWQAEIWGFYNSMSSLEYYTSLLSLGFKLMPFRYFECIASNELQSNDEIKETDGSSQIKMESIVLTNEK